MRHVSVWPAYVLHITLQKNAHTHTTDSGLQMDCRKYFWSKFLSGLMFAEITWKPMPAGELGSLSHSYSLCSFPPEFNFFPMLFCFSLISDSLHPINIAPCKHKRSQYVGANEYVMWQLISGSQCFPAWFMYNSQTTLTKFDLVSVSQFMGRHVLYACLEHYRINTAFSWYVYFVFFSSFAVNKIPVSDHLPNLTLFCHISQISSDSRTFFKLLYEYQRHQRALYLTKDIQLPWSAIGFVRLSHGSFFGVWTQCEALSYPLAHQLAIYSSVLISQP